MMTELIGTILQNRYQITKVLAQGGQSETFVAEDTHLPGHPECVVKRLKTGHKDPQRLANAKRLFEQEAEVLQTKLCPHFDQIPNLLAYFDLEGEFYLVQELIQGHPLSSEMPPGLHWSEERVIELLRDVLWILRCIHTQGVIHRDLKPDNLIRRSRDQKLVLIDFGAVKTCVWKEERAHTIAIGTLGYMPFEQAMGEPVAASDLYALGMIAIQALTGVLPRQLPKVDDGEVCWREQAPQVSEELAQILTQMVRYRPSQRFRNADQVLEALQIWAPEPDLAGQATDIPPLDQTHRSNKGTESSEETRTNLGPEVIPVSFPQTPPATRNPTLPVSTPPISSSHRSGWRSKIASVISMICLGGIATLGYTFWSQREAEFRAQLTLERMNTAIAGEDFEQCQIHMAEIPTGIPLFGEMQQRLGECQLQQAQWLAQQENWGEAIALAQSLSADLEIYPQAIHLREQWSTRLQRQELQHQLVEQGLSSEVGIDYSGLSELMAKGKWEEADQETDRLLLRITNRQQEEFLDEEALRTLSCTDLQTLDQLWTRLSGGQFGFSAQMQIWGRSGDNFRRFAKRVGWRQDNLYLSYRELDFDPEQAQEGALPFAAVLRGEQMIQFRDQDWWLYRDQEHFEIFFERLMECEMI